MKSYTRNQCFQVITTIIANNVDSLLWQSPLQARLLCSWPSSRHPIPIARSRAFACQKPYEENPSPKHTTVCLVDGAAWAQRDGEKVACISLGNLELLVEKVGVRADGSMRTRRAHHHQEVHVVVADSGLKRVWAVSLYNGGHLIRLRQIECL